MSTLLKLRNPTLETMPMLNHAVCSELNIQKEWDSEQMYESVCIFKTSLRKKNQKLTS